MSALLSPTWGELDTVLSILVTRTGWSRVAVLFDGTFSPVSGQYCVRVCPPASESGLLASGLELDEPPHAVSSKQVAVRADRDMAMRRTRKHSIGGWTSVGHRGGRGQ